MADNPLRQLFGSIFSGTTKELAAGKKRESFVPPVTQPGEEVVVEGPAGAATATVMNIGGDNAKDTQNQIMQYRTIAMQPEIEEAVDDIVSEAIAVDEDTPVKIILAKVNKDVLSDSIKEKIREEFNHVLRLLMFKNEGYDILRKWYVEGRILYHMVIDKSKPKQGIKELRQIDPTLMRKVVQVKQVPGQGGVIIQKKTGEYYVFITDENKSQGVDTGVKISKDVVAQANSGRTNPKGTRILSYLHKAIKPLNQLRMMEDAVVIYRISRAPERRIFYVDVGNMPKARAEQYLQQLMNKYRQKLTYDSSTGEITNARHKISMMEDYWMARREGGRGTEIDTLQGGENLGEIADIEYFKKRLQKSLNLPLSRLEADSGFSLGRAAEINRDELKFFKFIVRLRSKFANLFDEILRTQLLLKNIITDEEWKLARNEIFYEFAGDNKFTELKESEIMNERLSLMTEIADYVGIYYSKRWVRENVLHQTEEDRINIDKEIKQEKEDIEKEKAANGGDDEDEDDDENF